jgi:RecA-family ATPase
VRDPNARILQRKKANYAARNDEIRLRWRDGVMEPETPAEPGRTAFGRVDSADLFMSLLDEFAAANRRVSDNSRSGNYAPRAFGKLPREQRYDYREADFRNAMEKLFRKQVIENVSYGRTSDMRLRIERVKD